MKKGKLDCMPPYFKVWAQIGDSDSCMYSEVYHLGKTRILSDWEIANNPWWIDFPVGSYPDDEAESYKMHAQGVLSVPSDPVDMSHMELEMGATLESRIEVTGTQTTDRVPRQRGTRISHKGKEPIDIPMGDVPRMPPIAKRQRESFEFKKLEVSSASSNSKVHRIIYG